MTEALPISVEELDSDPKTIRAAIPDLAAVLADCVAGGASVGFMDNFGIAEAAQYYRGVFEDAGRGKLVLLGARRGGPTPPPARPSSASRRCPTSRIAPTSRSCSSTATRAAPVSASA